MTIRIFRCATALAAALVLPLAIAGCADPSSVSGATVPSGTISSTTTDQPTLPTEAGTPLNMAPIHIAIDHTGTYEYTSDVLPVASLPNSIGIQSKVVGDASVSNVDVKVIDTGGGKLAISAKFNVASFSGTPSFEVLPPVSQGTAGG